MKPIQMQKKAPTAPENTTPGPVSQQDGRTVAMNDLALRIWNNQSVSLPLGERVRRIKRGLIEQGYEDNLSALVLPVDGFERYL